MANNNQTAGNQELHYALLQRQLALTLVRKTETEKETEKIEKDLFDISKRHRDGHRYASPATRDIFQGIGGYLRSSGIADGVRNSSNPPAKTRDPVNNWRSSGDAGDFVVDPVVHAIRPGTRNAFISESGMPSVTDATVSATLDTALVPKRKLKGPQRGYFVESRVHRKFDENRLELHDFGISNRSAQSNLSGVAAGTLGTVPSILGNIGSPTSQTMSLLTLGGPKERRELHFSDSTFTDADIYLGSNMAISTPNMSRSASGRQEVPSIAVYAVASHTPVTGGSARILPAATLTRNGPTPQKATTEAPTVNRTRQTPISAIATASLPTKSHAPILAGSVTDYSVVTMTTSGQTSHKAIAEAPMPGSAGLAYASAINTANLTPAPKKKRGRPAKAKPNVSDATSGLTAIANQIHDKMTDLATSRKKAKMSPPRKSKIVILRVKVPEYYNIPPLEPVSNPLDLVPTPVAADVSAKSPSAPTPSARADSSDSLPATPNLPPANSTPAPSPHRAPGRPTYPRSTTVWKRYRANLAIATNTSTAPVSSTNTSAPEQSVYPDPTAIWDQYTTSMAPSPYPAPAPLTTAFASAQAIVSTASSHASTPGLPTARVWPVIAPKAPIAKPTLTPASPTEKKKRGRPAKPKNTASSLTSSLDPRIVDSLPTKVSAPELVPPPADGDVSAMPQSPVQGEKRKRES